MGFGWAPPSWGSGLAVPADIPLLGEPLWHESSAVKWVRNREMNQLFWNLIESAK